MSCRPRTVRAIVFLALLPAGPGSVPAQDDPHAADPDLAELGQIAAALAALDPVPARTRMGTAEVRR